MRMIKLFAPLIAVGLLVIAAAEVTSVAPAQAGSIISPDDPGSGGGGNGGRRR